MSSYRLWTDEEVSELKRLLKEREQNYFPLSDLAQKLGRSPGSVLGKASLLGLLDASNPVHRPARILQSPCGCGCGATITHGVRPPSVIALYGNEHFLRGHQNIGLKHSPEHIAATSRPMSSNGRWKGGKHRDKEGYVLVKTPDHPFANNNGYVREHRLVVEKKIGRYLDPSEHVHHINGRKNDNRPENLMHMSQAEHNRLERLGNHFPHKGVVYADLTCARCGVVFRLNTKRASYVSGTVRYCSWSCRYPASPRVLNGTPRGFVKG